MSVFSNLASRSAEQAASYTTAVLDLLGGKDPMKVLKSSPSDLKRALKGLSREHTTHSEAPGKWSIRQVLAHLADSELVWGYRLRLVLAEDRPRLVGFDQDLWSERLGYDAREAQQALEDFCALRAINLGLLARASDEDFKRVGVHTERGEESVEHMIRLYAGHDLLHLRQLARIRKVVTAA